MRPSIDIIIINIRLSTIVRGSNYTEKSLEHMEIKLARKEAGKEVDRLIRANVRICRQTRPTPDQ